MNTNKTQPATYKPFAISGQYEDWNRRNCDTCKKGYNNKGMKYQCEFETALDVAYCGGGKITAAVAKAIGMLENEGCDLWECPGWVRR